MTAISFDPSSEAHRADPYPVYAELRRHAPVCRVEKTGAYAVSRYEDVAFVLRNPELFSSSAMQTALANVAGAGGPSGEMSPADMARVGEVLQSLPVPGSRIPAG